MDFYDSVDWLNREPPYAFQWDHLLFVILGLAIGIFLAFSYEINLVRRSALCLLFYGY